MLSVENVRITILAKRKCGGMAEWLKAAVLKIASRAIVTGVRIPLPPFLFLVYWLKMIK
jgi:hypothetical protein